MKRMVVLLVAFGLFFSSSALAYTITVAQGADAVSLDPHRTNDQPSARVMRQIYDTLVLQLEDLTLVPGLAESWTQLDELTWQFRLRDGVTFHNGEPLRASDVKFTLDRLRDPATAAPAAFLVTFIDDIVVVDDLTVNITTKVPFVPMLSHLAHTATSILNEKAVTEAGEDYGTRVVVGTGPFKFVLWESASRIVLERNPNWWGGEVLPSQVVFRPIPEGTVRAIELETGAIDIAFGLEPLDARRLEADPNIRIAEVETLATHYIGFNVQRPPFNDVRVRRAINHAIDVDTIVEVIFRGQAVRATAPISPRVFGAHPGLEPFEYNPELARQLLAEAGHAGGFNTSIWTNNNPIRMQIAEVVQAQLGELGINVEIRVLEWGTYLADTAAGLHDMFILGWVAVTADADYGLYSLFHSSQFGDPGNRTFWSHPRVDELLDLARAESDPERRLAYYKEAQEIIHSEAPWVFLVITTEQNGLRANIEGFVPHPAGHHRLYNLIRN